MLRTCPRWLSAIRNVKYFLSFKMNTISTSVLVSILFNEFLFAFYCYFLLLNCEYLFKESFSLNNQICSMFHFFFYYLISVICVTCTQ